MTSLVSLVSGNYTISTATNAHLETLLTLILNTYFINSYCTIIISNGLSINDFKVPTVNIKNDLRTSEIKNILIRSWDLGCTDTVVHVREPFDTIDILEDIVHISNHRKGDRKLIIIPTNPNIEPEKILEEKSLQFVPNVLIIKNTEDENCKVFNLITHTYTGPSRNNEKKLLDEWSSCTGFKRGRNLFPHDMTNLFGKVVKVAVFQYEPYVFLNLKRTVAPEGYDGTEMRIVMEFCRWLNCTLRLVVDKKHEWGQIFDNRTGNGVIGAIAMDDADIGITALYSWYHEYKFLDLSMPAIRTGITCLVPPPQLLPGWKLIIIPFTAETWLSVAAELLLMIIVLWLTTKSSLAEVSFISYRMMIMQYGKEPMMKALRVLTIWYVLAGMILDSSYSGSLASSLTVPKYGVSIDTVKDLDSSGIEWGATHDAWIFSISSSTEPSMVRLVNKFKILQEEELSAKAKGENFGFTIERLPAGHYAVGSYIQLDAIPYLQLMHEDIYWEQCLMMARKSSPYLRKYNQLLSRLHSSGIILAWETQVVQAYSNMNIQIGVRHSHRQHRHHTTAPLAINKVLGAFIILGIGYGLSIITYLLELSLRKFSKRSTT